jgi:phage terminase small subunit
MAELKNPRHEAFAQNLMRGLTPAQAYVAAGFKRAGAAGNGARLIKTDAVLCRVNELRQAVNATVLQLAITERNERLIALQERWDALREAQAALAREDYAAAMKTGVVCRRLKSVREEDGKSWRLVTEYEINTPLIESLNSVERRAAIETGQEVDRQDINLRGGKLNANQEMLVKAYADDPMRLEAIFEEMRVKMLAAAEAEERGKVIGCYRKRHWHTSPESVRGHRNASINARIDSQPQDDSLISQCGLRRPFGKEVIRCLVKARSGTR